MNGHDSTREQNMEARMTLAAARRGLAAAINERRTGQAICPATIRRLWNRFAPIGDACTPRT